MSRVTSAVKAEVGLALESAALVAFAFSRPVLDSFGRAPETFIAHGAGAPDIVLFALGVAVLPALAVAAIGLLALPAERLTRSLADSGSRRKTIAKAARFAGPHLRQASHAVLVGVLAGVGAWRLGIDRTGWAGTAINLVLLGVVTALVVGWLRWWPRTRDMVGTFLRYAAVGVLVFPLLFLTGSPTGDLALGGRTTLDAEVTAGVSDALGEDAPPVVVVVFDALPTMSLLDGEGNIDAETFPGFGSLAGDATWYRNATTVAGFTNLAVPAVLTGRYPVPLDETPPPDSENLLTLLGGSHDVAAREPLTRLCPHDVCPVQRTEGATSRLLGDATDWWLGATKEPDTRGLDAGSAMGSDRISEAQDWIADLQLGESDRPDLTFIHVPVPHEHWQFTNDGTVYEMPEGRPTGTAFFGWSEVGVDVAEQRHMLQTQAADMVLGQLLDELRAAGTYDDALIVVTADHGAAFNPEQPQRHMSDGNREWVAWVPLLIKAPGQSEGEVDDGNVESVDVFPTVAGMLGTEIPWEVDGFPISQVPEERDPYAKTYAPIAAEDMEDETDEDGYITLDWRDHFDKVLAYEPPTGSGPDGPWKLTEHGDLVGSSVSELSQEAAADGQVVVNWPSGYEGIDPDEPLPLEVVAGTGLPEGAVVAFALNGTIGSVGEVQPTELPDLEGGLLLQGFLPPELFVEGDNELTAYLIEGAPGSETLHPLTVEL